MDNDDSERTRAKAREIEPQSQPSAGASRSNVDFGIVVGVEHYPYFKSLSGAATDATEFRDWLQAPDGGGLDPKNVRLILSNLEKETPVQDEIDREIVALLDAAEACGGARRLYFYFSGHGAAQSGNDVALLLTRWSKSLARLALSTRHYSNALCGVELFAEVAIFVDCCRSLAESVVGREPTITRTAKQLVGRTRTFIAYASEAGDPAHELPQEGVWRGIFTKRLLRILRMYPEGIGAPLLKDRLEREVETDARENGFFQRAHVEDGLLKVSRFGVGGTLPVLALRFSQRRGPVMLRNGQFALVAEHDADEMTWRLALPFGLYLLEGGGRDAVEVDHDGREVPHDV